MINIYTKKRRMILFQEFNKLSTIQKAIEAYVNKFNIGYKSFSQNKYFFGVLLKKSIFSIFILTTVTGFGQTLKSFNGLYANGKDQQGNATYKFYEDPETRKYLKQGAFSYNFVGQNEHEGLKQTIVGNYDKGLKDGTWTYKVNMADYKVGKHYHTGTITLVSHYKNGYADGNWTEKYIDKARQKYYSYGEYKWGDFEPSGNFTVSMNFKVGKIVGTVDIDDENFKAAGSYDQNSFAIGTWKLNLLDQDQNLEIVYRDNYMVDLLGRNGAGDILDGSTNWEVDYKRFIEINAMSLEEREEIGFALDTFCGTKNLATKHIEDYFDKMMVNDWFLYKYIGGDITYDNYLYTYSFGGGCNIVMQKVYYSSMIDVQQYKDAEEAFTSESYFKAAKGYYYFKGNLNTAYGTQTFKQSELKMLDQKIANSVVKADSLSKIYMTRETLDKYFADVNARNLDYQVSIVDIILRYLKSPSAANRNVPISKFSDEIFNYQFKQKYQDLIVSFENQDPVFYGPCQQGVLEYFKDYISFLNSEVNNCYKGQAGYNREVILTVPAGKSSSLNDIYYCPCIEDSLILRLASAGERYFNTAKSGLPIAKQFEDRVMQIEKLNLEQKTKYLYLLYLPFLAEFKESYQASKDLEESIRNLNKINLSLDKIIALYQGDTKPVDKELKKALTTEEQRVILFE